MDNVATGQMLNPQLQPADVHPAPTTVLVLDLAHREGGVGELSEFSGLRIPAVARSLQDALDRASADRPDVLLILDSDTGEALRDVIPQFNARHPEIGMLLSCVTEDAHYWSSALRAGVHRCIDASASPQDIAHAIALVTNQGSNGAAELAASLAGTMAGVALSPEEEGVLMHLARGASHQTIMRAMRLSLGEIEAYRARLHARFADGSHGALQAYAVRRTWTPPASGSLARFWRQRRLSLPEALRLGIQLAEQLEIYHAAEMSHGAVNPVQVFVHPQTADLPSFDLRAPSDFAEGAAAEDAASVSPSVAAGAYLAPESAGGVERPVDHRADFYSLGVVLYEALTGKLPFRAADPLEWRHAHATQQPIPPARVDPAIPQSVSRVVMKLLDKQPAGRYQTGRGLAHDLKRCQRAGEDSREADDLVPGATEPGGALHFPHTLFGRGAALQQLQENFERARQSDAAQVVTIAGSAGIGKTSLVERLRPDIEAAQGRFLYARFSSQKSDLPYAALAAGFEEFLRRILGGGEREVGEWRHRFKEALGPNAALLTALIPSLEAIVGPQPAVNELAPLEAQNRFRVVFPRFLGTFVSRGSPLVFFIDDAQWADPASLQLIKELGVPAELAALLVIVAYRSDEVVEGHPLLEALQAIRTSGGPPDRIQLQPLSDGDVNALVAESLRLQPSQVAHLSEVVQARSAGNPLFVRQLLTELCTDRLLEHDPASGQWRWDLEQIGRRDYGNDVLALIGSQLDRLSQETARMVALAACLGMQGKLPELADCLDMTRPALDGLLAEAEAAGVLKCKGDVYRFSHDRAQEAAYRRLDDNARARAHLRIGRRLLAHSSEAQVRQRLFEVLHHINQGVHLVSEPSEMARIRRLAIDAAARAKLAVAYAGARDYLLVALGLLPAEAWTDDYEQAFALHLSLAECEFVTGGSANAEELLDMLHSYARTNRDRARIGIVRINSYQIVGRFGDALAVALNALALFGVHFPAGKDALNLELQSELEQVQALLAGRRVADLLHAPRIVDGDAEIVVSLFNILVPPAFVAKPELFPLIAAKGMSHTLRHGNCADSCLAYTTYGKLLSLDPRTMPGALEFAALGLRLVEAERGSPHLGSVLFFNAILSAWRVHLAQSTDTMDRAFVECVSVGNLANAGYVSMLAVQQRIDVGESPDAIRAHVRKYGSFLLQTRTEAILELMKAFEQFARCMAGQTPRFGSLDDDTFSEARTMRRFSSGQAAMATAIFLGLKLAAALYAGEFQEALGAARKIGPLLPAVGALEVEATLRFHRAIAAAVQFEEASDRLKEELTEILQEDHVRLAQWAQDCPQNYLDRYALVSAEIARIGGHPMEAMRRYEEAISAAHESGFIQNEALALELASRLYRSLGIDRVADFFLQRAHDCYAQWGAHGKVNKLRTEHPALWRNEPLTLGSLHLDSLAMAKAAQAISSEVDLSRLVDVLLRITMEPAGASGAMLFLVEEPDTRLAAWARVEGQGVQVHLATSGTAPAAAPPPQPLSVVNYVRRTGEQVLVPDAERSYPFKSDEYFVGRRLKSFLCLPLIRSAKVVGVLYLENELVHQAFTVHRVAVLTQLAAQAAISLENARLYQDLARESTARARLVESNVIGIRIADAEGRILQANDAFLDIAGYSREDLDAGRLSEAGITVAEFVDADKRALDELRSVGRFPPYEKEYLRKDGTRVPALVGGASIEGVGSVAFVLDLTDRRQAEADRRARAAAEMANQAKSQFLANMSHELRTPLNAVLGYSQLLDMDRSLTQRQRHGIQTIQAAGEHLLLMIKDILDLSQVEAGKLKLHPQRIALRDFVAKVGDIIRVKADEKTLAFEIDCAPDLPQAVQADEGRLRQVLLNLLGNAVKFTDRGRLGLQVRRLGGDDSAVRLSFEVFDSGIGMEAHDVGKLFRPFEQVGDASRRLGGTGLGLALSQALVKQMGGLITVESKFGEGSRFRFDLELPVDEPERAHQPQSQMVASYAGPVRRVLVADDNDANRGVLVMLLDSLGIEVIEAVDGRDAIEKSHAFLPDLLLMDCSMPELGGLEVIRQLRALPAFASTPIFCVSASVTDADRGEATAAGADLFLGKPVDIQEIATAIQDALGRSAKRRA